MTDEKNTTGADTAIPEMAEVADELHPVLRWLHTNLKPVVAGIAAILIIVGGYGIYKEMHKSALEDASAKLGAILIKEDASVRLTELDAFAADAPEEMASGVRFEIIRAAMEKGDYVRAAAEWEKLGTVGGNIAFVADLGRGQALFLEGKPAEALAVFEEAMASTPETYKRAVTEMIASSAEASGNLERAIKAYEDLTSGDPRSQSIYRQKVQELKAQLKG